MKVLELKNRINEIKESIEELTAFQLVGQQKISALNQGE